jgi:hypothetical protein
MEMAKSQTKLFPSGNWLNVTQTLPKWKLAKGHRKPFSSGNWLKVTQNSFQVGNIIPHTYGSKSFHHSVLTVAMKVANRGGQCHSQ